MCSVFSINKCHISAISKVSEAVLHLWIFLLVMLHVVVCCAVVYVPCSLVTTCWERADLFAVMFVVFCHFPKMCPGPHLN